MFKQKCFILIVFAAVIILTLPFAAFSAEKADKDAVLQEIVSFIDKSPDVLKNTIFLMGDDYSRQNKTDEAIALYEKALKVFPAAEDLLNRAANLYNSKLDYAKAAETYKKITEINPDNIWNFQMLAGAYKIAGQKDKAAMVWENLAKNSNNAEVFMQMANFYNGENDTEKTVAAMKKAIELAPNNMSYLQALEGFYLRAENFTEAESICNKISSSAKEAWFKEWVDMELINIYQRQNKLPDLAIKFEKDLNQSAKDISNYRKLAELYQRNNEQDKAIAVYEKAIAQGLDDRDTNNRLLDLYERSSKFDKAEAQLRKIIGMAPQENYLYERLANLLNTAGKKDDAKKAWGELLAKAANDASVFSRYGDKLNEWGDTEGALEQYRKAQSIDAKNLWYTMRIADIFSGKGDFDAAKKELNSVIAKTADSWIKQEAERKIADIEAKLNAQKAVGAQASAVSAQAQAVAPQATSKTPAAAVVPAPAKPARKKKGLFSR